MEKHFGIKYYLICFFAAGIFGNIMSCLFYPYDMGVGSSGAASGIIGLAIIFIIYYWGDEIKLSCGYKYSMMLLSAMTFVMTPFSEYLDKKNGVKSQ
jgi:membrane associated rhomboid family serine protease